MSTEAPALTHAIPLALIIPCFNEEAVLGSTAPSLLKLMDRLEGTGEIASSSEVWFIDDGSSDGTWRLISTFAEQDRRVRGLRLSRNHGHQRALLAGLLTVRSEVAISMDADLQDDIGVIGDMLQQYRQGSEIVYGVRDDRRQDSWFKRTSARAYYRILRWMGVEIIRNHADFRLMSRRALEVLKDFPEYNLFLRGVIPVIGFKTSTVTYARNPRQAGETKYPVGRMVALAIDGVTSFTAFPLRLIAVTGVVICFFSLIMAGWVAWTRFTSDQAVPGWASSVLPVFLLGGLQLLGIGVLGEYIAKIYIESKRRPRFIVSQVIGGGADQKASPGTREGAAAKDPSE